MSDSTFIRNFDAEASKIKEIIASPSNVSEYLENLKIAHSAIENMLEQYEATGIKTIKTELLEAGIEMSQVYKTTIKADLPTHVPELSYALPQLKEPFFSLEMFSDDIYDTLFEYVDENADVNTHSGKKLVAKFYKTQKEILKELDEVREEIQDFEQQLVDFRNLQIQNIKTNILPILYKAHLSFVKTLNKSTIRISLTKETSTVVSGRQTEFIPASLKTWLGL